MEKDCSIDPQKMTNLIESNPENAEYIKRIVDNTLYITTEKLIQLVRTEFSKFVKDYPKYNLFIPDTKIGSEHMLLLAMEDLLHPQQILYGFQKPSNDKPIVIIDDAIYSSCNMCLYADLFQDLGVKNNIHCIVAFTSCENPQVVKEFGITIHSSFTLNHLTAENLLYDVDIYKIFGCESQLVLPLYFSHKIANAFGSYQFYHDIIKTPISREIIDRIKLTDIEEFIEKSKTKEACCSSLEKNKSSKA